MAALRLNPAKWGNEELVIFLALDILLAAIYLFVSFYDTPINKLNGHIRSLKEQWSLKYKSQCFIDIDTSVGIASGMLHTKCPNTFHVGDEVTALVRVNRLTGSSGIMYGTIAHVN